MTQSIKRRAFRGALLLSILTGSIGLPLVGVGQPPQRQYTPKVSIRFIDGVPQPIQEAGQSSNSQSNTVPANKVDRATIGMEPPRKVEQGPLNVATEEERNQTIAPDWENPWVVFFVTGRQYGYIEPCGCTGLENQKGGLMRRDSLLSKIKEKGWEVLPVDAGNQVRRIAKQSEIKFEWTAKALSMMGYVATTYGPDDLRGSHASLVYPLLNTQTDDKGNPQPLFISANVSVFDGMDTPFKVVQVGKRKIGITAVLGDEYAAEIKSVLTNEGEGVKVRSAKAALREVTEQLKAEKCDVNILIAQTSLEESRELAQLFPMFSILVTAGGYGEPTYRPEIISGTKTQMIQVGTKGMYAGLVGLFDDSKEPLRYQRLALSSQFEDSPRMNELFSNYQDQLKVEGIEALAPKQLHLSGGEFVGSEKCGECHTTAFDIWKNTPHSHATDSIVEPPERPIPRHFDPECLSCHTTGWNPQKFLPYNTGFESLTASTHLTGSGCENCHGPGKAHAEAESGDVEATAEMISKLRDDMKLPLDKAEEKCMECHDLDNSPDFHKDGAFQAYWQRIKHYGKD
ncbi:MAG: multiheme c-type cytochrome [Pirellula sp.]|jgi:hypothetical protein